MTWLLLAEAGVPEGGLFDLDATLPLMALQVVLLTFLLNSLFFRPVGKVVEEREGYISTSRADAKQKLAQVERLEADLTEQLREARQAAQSPSSKPSRKSTSCTARPLPLPKPRPIAPVKRRAVRSNLSVRPLRTN